MIKRSFKILLFTILGFAGFITLYLSIAFVLSRITVDAELAQDKEIPIYILTNGIHTDIVVPAKNRFIDWTQLVSYRNTVSKDSNNNWLAMGWGDKGFYLQTPTWADLKFSVAFKAATGLSTTAIHATYYRNMKQSETCKKILISKSQYQRLIAYIKNSFQTDENSDLIWINTNAIYGSTDAFYEAYGSYSIFYTCNTWTNNALKACGQKACYCTAFDTPILLKYKK